MWGSREHLKQSYPWRVIGGFISEKSLRRVNLCEIDPENTSWMQTVCLSVYADRGRLLRAFNLVGIDTHLIEFYEKRYEKLLQIVKFNITLFKNCLSCSFCLLNCTVMPSRVGTLSLTPSPTWCLKCLLIFQILAYYGNSRTFSAHGALVSQ